jgi:hypothetical protein
LETTEELRTFLTSATQEGVWGRLLYRGAAWSLMRSDGVLPDNAPPLGATIETDLAEHGFALLRAAMALRAREGSTELASKAFDQAAKAFEALVRNADPGAEDRGFRRTIAAAAYHLAGFSAVAYSLFNEAPEDLNAAPGETAVMLLILRDLDRLRSFVREWLAADENSDAQLSGGMQQDQLDLDTAVAIVLNTTICRALAFFDFALQTGDTEPMETARELLATGIRLADNAENVPLWWITSLCRHLIDDLWAHSIHENLPVVSPEGAAAEKYANMRQLFVGSLYARKNAEVELWPSQREAARRSTDLTDDLVVALPTSAGKTRVAEIAALMTLVIATADAMIKEANLCTASFPMGTGVRTCKRIRTIIRQVCKELGVQIVSGILSREHVHMLVEIPPHQPVSDFVRRVKGRSSHRLQREFSDLRMFVRLDPLRDLKSGNVGQFNIQHYEIGIVQAREFQRFDAASLRLGKGL